jgi:hypothetical protein
MHVGDKVRSIKGTEEGVITRVVSDKEVEVEIEDGFVISFLKTDLAVVSSYESLVFGKPAEKNTPKGEIGARQPEKPLAEVGLYLAFVPFNDQRLDVHLVNNTDLQVAAVFGERKGERLQGITLVQIPAKNEKRVHTVTLAQFEQWPPFFTQVLFFKEGLSALRPPLERELKFSHKVFFKNKRKAPVLGVDAYVFQLDGQTSAKDMERLKAHLEQGPPVEQASPIPVVPKIPQVANKIITVDLHLEALEKNGLSIPKEKALEFQLAAFEKAIDQALLSGVREITFVHGVGNGILRTAIHKRLSSMRGLLASFSDAQKEKFGYGATLVVFK